MAVPLTAATNRRTLTATTTIQQVGQTIKPPTLSCAHRAALLEAFAAEDWASLGRAERHRRLFAALRASRLRFGTHRRRATAVCPAAYAFRTLRLARFAAFGLVLEALVGEKHLFAGSKHKLRIAL